jgi:hypothetical protein
MGQLVVAEENEPTGLTGEGMLHREGVGAAVAVGGQVGGLKAIAEAQVVAKLLGREVSPIEAVGHDGDPSASAPSAVGLAFCPKGFICHQGGEAEVGSQSTGLGESRALAPKSDPIVVHIKQGAGHQGVGERLGAGQGGGMVVTGGLAWVGDSNASVAHREGEALPKKVGQGRGFLLKERREELGAKGILHGLEGGASVRDNALEILPLRLE